MTSTRHESWLTSIVKALEDGNMELFEGIWNINPQAVLDASSGGDALLRRWAARAMAPRRRVDQSILDQQIDVMIRHGCCWMHTEGPGNKMVGFDWASEYRDDEKDGNAESSIAVLWSNIERLASAGLDVNWRWQSQPLLHHALQEGDLRMACAWWQAGARTTGKHGSNPAHSLAESKIWRAPPDILERHLPAFQEWTRRTPGEWWTTPDKHARVPFDMCRAHLSATQPTAMAKAMWAHIEQAVMNHEMMGSGSSEAVRRHRL